MARVPSMPRTRGVRTALALGLVALALSACSTHREGPPPLSSADFVTSPPASATERPMPQVPAAAKVNSPAGAEAFARYVIGIYGYVYQTGNAGPLESVAGPKCTFCRKVRSNISDMKVKNYRQVGGDLTITMLSPAPDVPRGKAVFTAVVRQTPAQVLDADGKIVNEAKILPDESLLVALEWHDKGWTVFEIGSGDEAP